MPLKTFSFLSFNYSPWLLFFFLLTLKGMSMARTTELKDLWGEVRREVKLRVLQRTMMELKSQENLIAGGQMKRDC